MQDALRTGARTGALLLLTSLVTILTGRPFLFPSLGPSAYLLATAPEAATSQPDRLLGGHAIGVVAGLLAYHLLASGLVVTDPVAPLATEQVRLGASAVVSLSLTTAGMEATGYRHAPACATTLIVALGLLPNPVDGLIIMAAVGLLLLANPLVATAAPNSDNE
jgi:CBS-domain-containing membrane protein